MLLLLNFFLLLGVSAEFNAYFSFDLDNIRSGIELRDAVFQLRKRAPELHRIHTERDLLAYSEGFFMAENDIDFSSSLDERLKATFTELVDGFCSHSSARFNISYGYFTLRTPEEYIVKLKVIPESGFYNVIDAALSLYGFESDVNHTGEIVIRKYNTPVNYSDGDARSTILLRGVTLMLCNQPNLSDCEAIHSAEIPRDCHITSTPAPTTHSLGPQLMTPIRTRKLPHPSSTPVAPIVASSTPSTTFPTLKNPFLTSYYPNYVHSSPSPPLPTTSSSTPPPLSSTTDYPEDLPTAQPNFIAQPSPRSSFANWLYLALCAVVTLVLMLCFIVIVIYCRYFKREEPVVKKASGIHPNPL